MIRVTLPGHLQALAGTGRGVVVTPEGEPTIAGLLDALERQHPTLRGTIRDHGTLRRRPFLRYFACGQDLSHDPTDERLPDPVVRGEEPFMVIGAVVGG